MAARKPRSKAKSGGRQRALCVGINDYPGSGSDLNGCVNDAKDWKAALADKGYDVTLLLDADATRKNIMEGLEDLVGNAKSDSKLVFTFSGHGSWLPDTSGDEADGRDEMLCPHDLSEDVNVLDDDLAEVFGRKPKGARLHFISDSCHSGTVARFAPPFGGAARSPIVPRFLPPTTFLTSKKMIRAAERVESLAAPARRTTYPALLLAGCRDHEYSYDASFGSRPNGAFTYFALQALKNAPSSARAWMSEIRQRLPSASHPQTPQIYGGRADKDGPTI
jgi:hypothetical protein